MTVLASFQIFLLKSLVISLKDILAVVALLSLNVHMKFCNTLSFYCILYFYSNRSQNECIKFLKFVWQCRTSKKSSNKLDGLMRFSSQRSKLCKMLLEGLQDSVIVGKQIFQLLRKVVEMFLVVVTNQCHKHLQLCQFLASFI